MDIIKVKAVAGRVARISPRGAFIPHDRFIPVENTFYIQRLLRVHGDIELQPADEKPSAKQDRKPDQPVKSADAEPTAKEK